MPETEFRLKATGGEETKRTFKSVVDYARQLDKYASKPVLSAKEMDSARVSLSKFNQERQKTLTQLRSLKKEEQDYYNLLNKNAALQNKVAKGSQQWHEFNRRSRYLERGLAGVQKESGRLSGALQVGGAAGENLEGRQEVSPGVVRGIMKAVFGVLGLATAIGIARKSIGAANSVNDNLMDLGGTLAGVGNAGSGRMVGGMFYGRNQQITNLMGDIQGNGPFSMRAQALGFSNAQTVPMMNALAATGGMTPDAIEKQTLAMLNTSRGYGVNPESITKLIATGAQGGIPGSTYDLRMAKIIGDKVSSGFQRTTEEWVNATDQLTSVLQQTAGSAAPERSSHLLALLAANSNSPFLQGTRGAQTLEQLNSSLMNPGGGVAGQLAMLNIAGFGHSGMSWWGAQKKLSGGFANNPELLAGLLQQAQSYGTEGGEMFLSQVGGLSPLQAQAMFKARKGIISGYTPGMSKEAFNKLLGQQGVQMGMPGVTDTMADIQKRGLGDALASLNTRAAMTNAWQDIGVEIIDLLATIAHNTLPMAQHLMTGPQGPAYDAGKAAHDYIVRWLFSK
jgi:hypothetical protein